MESHETDALLVRAVDYRDHHRIVTLLTPTLGKIGAVAYGARSSRSRFAGALQPFQRVRVILRPRPGRELLEMREAEVLEVFGAVVGDPARYAIATWVLELLRETSAEGDRESGAFGVGVDFLRRLERHGASPWLVIAVLLEILRGAGLEPALERCASCGRPAPQGRPGYFDATRGLVCTACGGSGPIVSGRARADALRARRWEPPESASSVELAQVALLLCNAAHHHAGKELRAWSLLGRQLRTWADSGGV